VEKDRIVSVLEMKGIGLDRRDKDLAFLAVLQGDNMYEERPTN
jgi:hypothetical protein